MKLKICSIAGLYSAVGYYAEQRYIDKDNANAICSPHVLYWKVSTVSILRSSSFASIFVFGSSSFGIFVTLFMLLHDHSPASVMIMVDKA